LGSAIVGFISLGLVFFFGAWMIVLAQGGSLFNQAEHQKLDAEIEANNVRLAELDLERMRMDNPQIQKSLPDVSTGCYAIMQSGIPKGICP